MEPAPHESSLAAQLCLALLFLVLSAFFSSAETALMSTDRVRLQHLADKGNRAAQRVLKLRLAPQRLLATLLLGNNVVNVAAASLATAVGIRLLGVEMGILVATALTTLFLLVLCEVVPKSMAAANPERVAAFAIGPVHWILIVLRPVVWLLEAITAPIVGWFVKDDPRRRRISEDYIRTVVQMGMREGAIDRHESRFMQRVLDMGDTEIHQIMTPLKDVQSIPFNQTVRGALNLLSAEGHSRLPVWRDSPKRMIGIVHLKDLARLSREEKDKTPVSSILLPAHGVGYRTKVDDVLLLMQQLHAHMVIITKDDGSAQGVATIEDVLEEIVGEIRDEHDYEEFDRIRIVRPGEAVTMGSVSLHEVEDALGIELPHGDYRTLQGLITSHLNRGPTEGDRVVVGEAQIFVEVLTKKRVTRARIRVLPSAADPQSD